MSSSFEVSSPKFVILIYPIILSSILYFTLFISIKALVKGNSIESGTPSRTIVRVTLVPSFPLIIFAAVSTAISLALLPSIAIIISPGSIPDFSPGPSSIGATTKSPLSGCFEIESPTPPYLPDISVFKASFNFSSSKKVKGSSVASSIPFIAPYINFFVVTLFVSTKFC